MEKMENMEMENAVMTADDVNKADLATKDSLSLLKNPAEDFYCTIPDDGSYESRVAKYNALNGGDKKVSEMLGKTIELVDVAAHPVQLADEETGEIIETLRTVLIDKHGNAYSAVSAGITNSLQKLFMIFGSPHWDNPVKVEVRQIQTRNGNNKVNTLVAVK